MVVVQGEKPVFIRLHISDNRNNMIQESKQQQKKQDDDSDDEDSDWALDPLQLTGNPPRLQINLKGNPRRRLHLFLRAS